jgi:hypothetical protein
MDAESKLDSPMEECSAIVKSIAGQDDIKEDKFKNHASDYLLFDVWRVGPK